MRGQGTGWIAAGLLLMAAGGLWAEDPGEKAARYHKLLLKRPDNKTIYERFYDAWLDEGTKEGLENFLGEQAKSGGVNELWILANYHQQAGRDEAALDALDQAVEKDQANAGLLMMRAKVQGRLLKFEEAIEDLEKVTEGDPDEVIEALKLKGGFLARAGRPEEGVKAWKDLLQANPDDDELVEDLIELEIGEGLYEEALEAASKLAADTKDAYQKALRRLRVGEIQKLYGKAEDAVKTYSTVLDSTGHGTWMEREVLAQIDELFKRDDDFAGLKAFYEKTAEAQPQRLQLKKALAAMTAEAGEIDEAVKMMREMMRLSPGDRGLREDLVDLLALYDREKEAAGELEKLLESDQKNAVLWERLADLRHKADDKEGLKVALEKVDGLADEGEEARLRMARLYERFELKEEAERILRAAAEGDSLEAQEALASFLMDVGREEEALAQWRAMAKGVELDGLMRVARSLQARGKIKEAYELMVARRADFGRDPVSLAMFCQIAQMSDQAGEALVEARKLVTLADQPTEIHDAVTVASRLIKRAGKEEEVLDSLGENAAVNDLCLGAELSELIGDSAGADALLRRAEEAGGGLLVTTQKVQVLERRGDFTKAAAAMKSIVDSEVGRRPIYRKRLVGLMRRAGDLEGALAEIERWKQATPGDKMAWMAQADIHLSAGDYEKAVTVLRRAQARFGKEEDIQVSLANAYLETGDATAAQHVFEKLYEDADQSSDKVRWAARLAEVAEDAGTVDELVGAFERRKRNNAKSIVPLLALAEIYNTLNRYDDRRAALQEATRRRPKDLSLRFNLARVEERAGDLERAVESLKAARKHDRTGATQLHLARLLVRYGEIDEALAMLRESDERKVDPRDVEDMVEVMAQEQEWEAARSYLVPFVARNPNDFRLRYLLALCTEEAGEEERALELFLEMVRVSAVEGAPLPGVKPILAQKDREHWSKFGKAVLPPRAMQLNVVYFYLRYAYAYRTSSQNSYRAPAASLPLPGDSQEAWALSICHLMNLVRTHQGKERDQLMAKLEAQGVEDHELLLMATDQTGVRQDLVGLLNRMLEKEPGDEALLLLALTVNQGSQEQLDSKWLRAAREKFREEMPLIALLANQDLLRGGDEEARKEAWKALPGILEILEGVDLDAGLNAAASIIAAGASGGIEVSEDQRKEMFELLMKRFREKKSPRPFWSGLESSLMHYATTNGRYDMVVEIMNGVCGQPPPPGPANLSRARQPYFHGSLYSLIQSRAYRYSNQYQQRYFPITPSNHSASTNLIPYPPTSLSTVPAGLVSQLRLAPEYEDRRLAAFVKQHSTQSAQFDRAKLIARLDEVKDRSLRLMILAYAEDASAIAKEIEAVAEKEDLGFDEALFAAGYYERKEGGKMKAMEIMVQLRAQPLDSQQAGVVDSHLLMLGAELHEKEELPEELLTVAKRAGLRVRRQPGIMSALSQQHLSFQRGIQGTRGNPVTKVTSALKTLGVTAAKRPGARRRISSSRASGGSNLLAEEIGKLVEKGNRKAAVGRAARELERNQRATATNRNASSVAARLVKVVEGLGLTEDTLKHLDPGEEGGELRQVRFAAICQLFKRTERARAAYERVVAMNPKNSVVKAKLFGLMSAEERSKVLEGMELGEEAVEVLKAIYGTRTSSSTDFKQIMELARTFTLLLEMTKPDGKATRDFSLVNYRAIGLMNAYNFGGGVRVRKLTEKKEKGQKDSKETVAFHSAFYDLCIAMLRHPQTAVQGFQLLHFCSEARGDELNTLENEAMLALMAMAKTEAGPHSRTATNNRWALQSQRGWSSSGSMPGTVPAPAEYLLWLAGEEDRPELLAEDFLNVIAKNAPVLAKRIRSYRRVVFSKGKERIKAFSELPESLNEASVVHSASDVYSGLRILMGKVGDDLEFVNALGESMLDFKFDRYGQVVQSQLTYSVLPVYGQQLLESQGRQAFEEFLLKVSTKMLGERKDWDLVEKAYSLGVQGIRNKGRAHSRIMEALLQNRETSLLCASHLARNGLDRLGVNNLQHYLQNSVQSAKMTNAAEVERFFQEGGFLAGAAGFDPLSHSGDPLSYQKVNTTLLEMLCGRVRSSSANEKIREVGVAWMKAAGDNRFSKRLIGAAMQKKPADHQTVVAGELMANKAAIEAMPIKQQVALARFLSLWFGQDLKKEGFPQELAQWREDIGRGGREQARQQVEELLEKGFVYPDEYSARQAMHRAVLSSIHGDKSVAAQLAGRYVKDVIAMKAAGINTGTSFSSGLPVERWDSGIRELSYRWRNGGLEVPNIALFVTELLKQPEAAFLSFDTDFVRSMGASIRVMLREIDKRPEVIELQKQEDKTKRDAEYWGLVVDSVTEGVPAESEGVVAIGLAYYLLTYWSVSSENFQSVLAAAKGLEKKHRSLSLALELGARARRSNLDEEGKKQALEVLTRFLRDEAIPNELRYEFLGVFTTSSSVSWLASKEVAEPIVEVLNRHCNGERNILTGRVADMVSRVGGSQSNANPEARRDLLKKLIKARDQGHKASGSGSTALDRGLLLMTLRVGENEILNQVLKPDSRFRGDLELMRQLVLTGKSDFVPKILPAPREFFVKTSAPQYDKAFEQALAAFLPKVESEEGRYRIACLLSGLNDAEEPDAPEEGRAARLERLVGEFQKVNPKDSATRLELLALFAETEGAPKEFLDELRAEAAKVILAHSIVLKGTSFTGTDAKSRAAIRYRSSLVPHAVRLDLREGKVEQTIKQFEGLQRAMKVDQSGSEANRAFGTLLPHAVAGVVDGMLDSKVPKKVYLPFIDVLMTTGIDKRHQGGSISKDVIAIGVVMHAMAGAGTEFDTLVEGLPDDKKEIYVETRKTYGLRSIFKFWAAQPNWDDDQKTSTRREILRAVLSDEATCQREIRHMTDLSKLMESNAFEKADLLAVIDGLPEDHPRRAEFILEKAGVIGWGGQAEAKAAKEGDELSGSTAYQVEADKNYALAIKLAGETNNEALLSQAHLYHALYTHQVLMDADKAHEIAKAVKPDLLVERDRKMYDKEIPQWKEAAENK